MREIRVCDYDADKIEAAAERLDVTVAEIIEWLVEDALDRVIKEVEGL